jgi:hypothetical protein
MKSALAIVALLAIATPPLSAQIQGDSIRLRVPPSRAWTHGRFLSPDDDRLTISHADSIQSYSLGTIGRFEMRRRKSVAVTLVSSTLAAMAGAGLAILIRPDNRKSIFGSDGAALAVSAGLGLAVGALELSISPWHWKRVHPGVKAAT